MKILLLTVILWTFISCSAPEQTEIAKVADRQEFVTPVNWKSISACSVKFSVPPDLEEKKPYYVVHFMGDCIKAYGSENIWLNIMPTKTIGNSSKFANQRDFQIEKAEIDGKQSQITTFMGTDMVNEAEGKEYVAILDVPQMRGTLENLTMWSYSKSPADREIVIRIFKSVNFPRK